MRAGQHFRRNEADVQTAPYFDAIARLVGRQDDSDDEDAYGGSPDNFRVYRTQFTNAEREEIVSKSFHCMSHCLYNLYICI